MNEKVYSLLGVAGPLLAFVSTGVSIALSPWFSWWENALSDLGHSVESGVAPIFNLGLLTAGFLTSVYAITVFREHSKYTSVCMVVSAFLLQLVSTFDEVYGFLHYVVSVLFFVSMGAASVAYAVERRSVLSAAAFVVGLSSWALYWMKAYSAGVAVPEAISSAAVASWVMSSALKIHLQKRSEVDEDEVRDLNVCSEN